MTGRRIADASVGLLTVLFALACAAFVRQDGLGTFADDSVSYLVMAQVFSPWHAASPPVAEAFRLEAFHPPLFPAVLALANVAHDIAGAHVFIALLMAACLPLGYLLATRWLAGRGAAALAAASVAALPVLWIQARGILSEPLFCALLLGCLVVMERDAGTRANRMLLALLLAALALTRTAGVVMALAYAGWAAFQPAAGMRQRAGKVLPGLVAVAAYAAWVVLRPAEVLDMNAQLAAERFRAILAAEEPVRAVLAGVARQAQAMGEAWAGALLLFWVEGQPARPVLAGAVAALGIAGLVMRLMARKPDAWMLVAYLGLYLLWPFYDQMTRFLFPVLPLVLLYAFVAVQRLIRRPILGPAALALATLSLAAPGLAFIHQRARTEAAQARIVDWYRVPDLASARARSQVHLELEGDMKAIRRLVGPEARVMWVAPAYIALLAQRHAVPAADWRDGPEALLKSIETHRPHYVFLSEYHPRDTIRDEAWRVGLAAMSGRGTVVHARHGPEGRLSAVLVRLMAESAP